MDDYENEEDLKKKDENLNKRHSLKKRDGSEMKKDNSGVSRIRIV